VRLLLDEMLSPATARQLQDRGRDVEAIAADPARTGLSYREVLQIARDEHRALVTNNVADFRRLHHEAIVPGGPGHVGMVFPAAGYRRTRAGSGRVAAALEARLAELPGEHDLADGEIWL
jgi:predicted nuclease of predicted toxin-antitoxin system